MLLHKFTRLKTCFKFLRPLANDTSQQIRTATVLRRVNRPPLLTKGTAVTGRITQEDLDRDGIPKFLDGVSGEFIWDPWYLRYEVIEEDADATLPPVKVILMKSMEDFGKRGQVLAVPAEQAHKELLLPGFARYASPENLERYSDMVIPEDSIQYSSEVTQKNLSALSKIVVPVVMSGDPRMEAWSIEPWHIRVALRRYAGIFADDDESIIMSVEKTIKGPNSSYHGKEFLVQLKINDLEIVPIRCILYQTEQGYSFEDDEQFDDVLEEIETDEGPDIPPSSWYFTFNEPIFEDQRNELYMLPRYPLPIGLTDGRNQLAAAATFNMSADEGLELVQKYTKWKNKRDKDLYDAT